MPKILTTDGIGERGPRHYFPEDDPTRRYPGVTTITGMVPKDLSYWSASMAADYALEKLPLLAAMKDSGEADAARKMIAGSAGRYTRERSRIGSQAHDMFERQIRGQKIGHVHPDMVGYRDQFDDFLQVVRPELVRAEDIAWSDTHQYAGSFDALLKIRLNPETLRLDPAGEAALVVADWKTGKRIYPDVALQMSAYAGAETLIDPDGNQDPMPAVAGAVVLSIHPDDWDLRSVNIGPEVFRTFLALRQSVFPWDRELSRKVIGKSLAKSQGEFQTGTQRRAK